MRKFVRVLAAYVLATLFVSLAAWVVWRLLVGLAYITPDGWPAWAWVSLWWLVVVGGPSALWGAQHLGKSLGVSFELSSVVATNKRSIPVVGAMADGARRVVGGAPAPKRLEVVDGIEFKRGRWRWPEPVMERFLWRCWLRQERQRKPPLSRTYWVDRRGMPRQEYDALVRLLEDYAFVDGRSHGRSGRLSASPDVLLSNVKHGMGLE